jgi:hypothetical protein
MWLFIQIQVEKKINESILQQKWPKIYFDIKNDAYELFAFAYNREMMD